MNANHPLPGHSQQGGGFAAADTPMRRARYGAVRRGQAQGLPTDARYTSKIQKTQDHYIGSLYGFRGLPGVGASVGR